MFPRNPDKIRIPAEVRVMWPDGPSRRYSETRIPEASLPYGENGCYVGNYICQHCTLPCQGVYGVKVGAQMAKKWLCSACLDASKPRKVAK
jgi:hypothetical protein